MERLVSSRRGYYFSLDALVALILILSIILFIKPSTTQSPQQVKMHEDLLQSLSSLTISELNTSYAQTLVASGAISRPNQTVLEQIGEFYASSDPRASLLAQSVLDEIDVDVDIALYYGNQLLASSNTTSLANASSVWTSRQIISGIQEGSSATGFSARAFLSSSKKVDYLYFGGYIGDGNITYEFDDDIADVDIEGVFSGNFSLYINDAHIADYAPPSNIPYTIDLGNYSSNFTTGTNYLSFRSVPDSTSNIYLAGGFIKITHNDDSELLPRTEKHFPGISGLINYYDSLYVPGPLNSMEIFLHYNSSFELFLTVGNTTVYRNDSSGMETTVTLTNSELASVLDYSQLQGQTIPIRLGLFNVSYLLNETREAHVFSVTDLSGSMAPDCSGAGFFCCWGSGDFCSSEPTCSSCGGSYESKIDAAKEANIAFVHNVLNFTANRVGLIGYEATAQESDYHQLSQDNASLIARITGWSEGGSTCICCGINKAIAKIQNESNSSAFQSMVVMSDGVANVQCPEQNTGDASDDAIQAACDAQAQGIRVYAVGFGTDADEVTLQGIASCGDGSYYYSDIDQLSGIYEQIAQEILDASYFEQTIVSDDLYTTLYSDSYISLDYNRTIPHGLVITGETAEFGNSLSEGDLFVPNDTVVYEARAISYSGSRWTDKVYVYNTDTLLYDTVFNLSAYGLDYVELGDPFFVHIPPSSLRTGQNNTVLVTTGLGNANSSGGSPYNKLIYTFVKNVSSFTPIVSSAEGCLWTIQFEDDLNQTVSVPEDYSGGESCSYTTTSIAYNENDAIDVAIYNLLVDLDLNSNQKIDIKFADNNIGLSTSEIVGIPFTWDTEAQVRIWR